MVVELLLEFAQSATDLPLRERGLEAVFALSPERRGEVVDNGEVVFLLLCPFKLLLVLKPERAVNGGRRSTYLLLLSILKFVYVNIIKERYLFFNRIVLVAISFDDCAFLVGNRDKYANFVVVIIDGFIKTPIHVIYICNGNFALRNEFVLNKLMRGKA